MGDEMPQNLSWDFIPVGLLLGPFFLVTVIYLVLRWVVRIPGGGVSPVSVTQHALWVGVIGWLASSLQSAGMIGILPNNGDGPLTNALTIIPVLAWPILGVLAVHGIGQVSYPGHRLERRQATLEVRRIRDFLPVTLGWVTLAIFVLAALQIAVVATLPGFSPRPFSGGEVATLGADGRIAGLTVAAYLGLALMVLAMGTWAVLLLITRRRQLEALDPDDNATLRTIAMNRLLRTVATVASGLTAIAGNFAVRPEPENGSGSWTNVMGIVNLVVLLAMWRWAPPTLAFGSPANTRVQAAAIPESQPSTRLVVSLGPAMWLGAIVPMLLLLAVMGPLTQPAVIVAVGAAGVLGMLAFGEILLHANYGATGASAERPPLIRAAAVVTGLALALLAAAIVTVALRQAALGAPPAWVATAIAGAAVLLMAVGPIALLLRRRPLSDSAPGLDAALRGITLHRVLRTVAACSVVQAGVLFSVAAPSLQARWPLNPDPSAIIWQGAPLAGAFLIVLGIAVALVPLRRLITNQAPSVRSAADAVP